MAGADRDTSSTASAADEQPSTLPGRVLCPECGWREGTKPKHPCRPLRSPTLIPVVLVAAAAIALVLWCVRGSISGAFGMGVMHAPYVDPPWTLDSIASLVEQGDDAGAAQVLRDVIETARESDYDTVPGARAVSIGFASAAQRRNEVASVGWPAPWWSTIRASMYQDALNEQGRVPSRTDTTAAPTPANFIPQDVRLLPPPQGPRLTSGSVFIRQLPEHTDGVLTYTKISPGSISTVPLAGLLVWWVMMLVTARWRDGESRRTRRRICFWAALLVASSTVVVGVANASRQAPRLSVEYPTRQANQPGESSYFVREGCLRLSWTLAELESRFDEHGFAARVAGEIASAQAAPGMYLTAITVPEANYVNSSLLIAPEAFPLVTVIQEYYVRRSDFGPIEPMGGQSGLSINFNQHVIGLALGTGNADQPVHRLNLHYGNLSLVVLALAAIWWSSRRVCLWWWRRRGWGRFRAADLCPQCGYHIGAQVATPGPYHSP